MLENENDFCVFLMTDRTTVRYMVTCGFYAVVLSMF